jgi:sugar-specific transcriptional regulator TrmB
MIKTLRSLGFKHLDAEVYFYLTQNNQQEAAEIAEALETYKRQIYRGLRNLQRKGVVSASEERPAWFSAISIEKVLDRFIKVNRDEADRIEENKEQILLMWRSKILRDSEG